ncbi:MAG TPA: ABC transporter ATP-binding protein [Acidimicrobiales bacterium]
MADAGDANVTKKSEDTTGSKWRALWYMVVLAFRADPLRATAALLAAAVGTGSQALVVYVTSRIIAAGIAGDVDTATRLAISVALLSALGFTASMLRLDLRFRMEESTALLIDRQIIELSTGIPGLEHHERPEHLDRLELLRSQRRMLGGSVGALIENVGSFSSAGTTLAMLFTVDPRLLLLPVFGIPSILASAKTRRTWQRVEEETTERNRLVHHLFELGTTGAPAKELRVFGLRDELRTRHQVLTAAIHAIWAKTVARATTITTAGWSVFAIGYVGAIVFVLREAIEGRISAAEVVLVVSLAGQVNQQVGSLYWMVGWLFDTLKTVGRYLALVGSAAAAQPRIDDPRPAPETMRHGIDLVGVTFRYPGTENDVLRNVDLHLPAGSTVALVGDNGAGKSSLVKLLSRFYDPTSGVIEVDGTDLRRIPPAEWRSRMSAGFQDFARLELVARESVGVGHLPDMDDAALVGAALDRASAGDVVTHLADGLETLVGRRFDGGVDLSGGQWQKLALGRAMMRERPLLLVLDEPTAALDADTEHELFERYAGAAQAAARESGAITVLVSHRFSTVRMADLIVVVGDGAILEHGTHEDLMSRGGVYAELYELQASAYR